MGETVESTDNFDVILSSEPKQHALHHHLTSPVHTLWGWAIEGAFNLGFASPHPRRLRSVAARSTHCQVLTPQASSNRILTWNSGT